MVRDGLGRIFAFGGIAGMTKGARLRTIEVLASDDVRLAPLAIAWLIPPIQRGAAFLVGLTLELAGRDRASGLRDPAPPSPRR